MSSHCSGRLGAAIPTRTYVGPSCATPFGVGGSRPTSLASWRRPRLARWPTRRRRKGRGGPLHRMPGNTRVNTQGNTTRIEEALESGRGSAVADHGHLHAQQYKGATYRQLCAIAHKASVSYEDRMEWYELAESLGVAQPHASHILGRRKKEVKGRR